MRKESQNAIIGLIQTLMVYIVVQIVGEQHKRLDSGFGIEIISEV